MKHAAPTATPTRLSTAATWTQWSTCSIRSLDTKSPSRKRTTSRRRMSWATIRPALVAIATEIPINATLALPASAPTRGPTEGSTTGGIIGTRSNGGGGGGGGGPTFGGGSCEDSSLTTNNVVIARVLEPDRRLVTRYGYPCPLCSPPPRYRS